MNYKIEVNNEAESKEAQELFFELGCQWAYKNIGKNIFYEKEDIFLYADKGGSLGTGTKENQGHFNGWCGTLVSLPELRDLVVLKRNDRKDANVSEENCLYDLYLTESKELYFYHCGKNKWILSNLNGDDDYYEKLKPIEKKEMKEYLVKNENTGAYDLFRKYPDFSGESDIEIPEWANFAAFNQALNNYYFNKENIYIPDYVIWQRDNKKTIASAIESVNDKVASAELARQESKEWGLGDYAFAESDAFIAANIEEDNVNSPSHYASGEIECIDAIESSMTHEAFCGYLKGNVQKYMWRYEDKGGIESLEKAQWYLNKLIKVKHDNS